MHLRVVAVLASLILLTACTPEKEYRDRDLNLDLVGCFGTASNGAESTCRTEVTDSILDAPVNGCFLVRLADEVDAPITYAKLNWDDATRWFNIVEPFLLKAKPGQRLEGELYLFQQADVQPACESGGIDFGTACSEAAPWCLLRMKDPTTTVGENGLTFDFGATDGACDIAGPITEGVGSELCDGADNDCDGRVDEGDPGGGMACETSVPGICQAGTTACRGGEIVCFSDREAEAEELCDGLDNDCDGTSDEGFNLGDACTVGEGVCARSGGLVCDALRSTACNVSSGQPEGDDADCNGVDEDCDGTADEHFPESPHPCESGICETTGVNVCVAGEDGPEIIDTCTQSAVGAEELCGTGVDEDCDRSVDEGFESLGADCEVGLGICRNGGELICDRGEPALLALKCSVTPFDAEVEVCDVDADGSFLGLDNDCDGFVDEFEPIDANVQRACDTGEGCLADADADGVSDLCDNCPQDANEDQLDTDADAAGDACDDDDDADTVLDADDSDPTNPNVCADSDGDGCDDCTNATAQSPGPDPSNDGLDTDGDGQCDTGSIVDGDLDDDGDTIPDVDDVAPLNPNRCQDLDFDGCDDCAILGMPDISNDGVDTDDDGICDLGDNDDDNDGVVDGNDSDPLVSTICRDVDGDGCDDCANLGPDSPAPNPNNDGPDADGDGICDSGDNCVGVSNFDQLNRFGTLLGDVCEDSDGDTVLDSLDAQPLNASRCFDGDGDGCDDCSITQANGAPDVSNDGVDADGDGICDLGDADNDNDTVPDGQDSAPNDPSRCQDIDNDSCDDCALTQTPQPANDGTDTDGDGACDIGDEDDDDDTVLDADDIDPLDPTICTDVDADGCDDCALGSTPDANNDGIDTDSDGICDDGDNCLATPNPDQSNLDLRNGGDVCDDIDGDSVLDAFDPSPFNVLSCGDSDADTCDDCVSGTLAPANDGPDFDGDGFCDAGDDDDDNDGRTDDQDTNPLDPNTCSDTDNDTCDDCVGGTFAPGNDGADFDVDGLCDIGDPDDDNDGSLDAEDSDDNNANVCSDIDNDNCDDCVSGGFNPANDGADFDGDGLCDIGDPDDDNDGVSDANDDDASNPNVCSDNDNDGCDDCSSGSFDPANDGADFDTDGTCDLGDTDDDNDGVLDASDSDAKNPNVCSDNDNDGCDDCSSGSFDPANDGADFDGDGTCDLGDTDDDNDGVLDASDSDATNPNVCSDNDGDNCDDCSSGSFDTANDGADFDADGFCDVGDTDDDNDGVDDDQDTNRLDPNACSDNDNDGCDDCSGGAFNPAEDGADFDVDGLCDIGDPDDDNDGSLDVDDSDDRNSNVCSDIDNDTCDDCVSGTFGPGNDGFDFDGDGLCDIGDPDDDNDGSLDAVDSDDSNPNVCSDNDNDGCDDCSSGSFDPANDGADFDTDGTCDLGDTDDDNDGVLDASDSDAKNPNVCSDNDNDGCDDCSSGSFDPANDGADFDGDGTCDLGDTDDDNDGVLDASDSDATNPNVCSDNDGDNCDDCSSGSFDTANDGADFDADGFCDVGDTDDDNDGVDDDQDTNRLDPNACSDNDNDGCDDCSGGAFNPAEDGADFDVDGLCDIGDPDDDNDGSLDVDDSDDRNSNVCSDIDNDTCDDCVSGTFGPGNDGFDFDGDGLCDIGDPDDDNDGSLDAVDSDDSNPNVCSDNDNDGCDDCSNGSFDLANDGAEFDVDGDGLCNTFCGDGVTIGLEACDDGNEVNDDQCSNLCELNFSGESCAALLAAQPNLVSGIYLIDVDGEGPNAPIEVFCDMTTDGGGWTRVIAADSAEINGSDPPDFRYNSDVWSQGYGDVTDATHISQVWLTTPAFNDLMWIEDANVFTMAVNGAGNLADLSTANGTIKLNVNQGCGFGPCGGRVFRQWHNQQCNTANGSTNWGLGLGAIRTCQRQFGTLFYEASFNTTSLWIR